MSDQSSEAPSPQSEAKPSASAFAQDEPPSPSPALTREEVARQICDVFDCDPDAPIVQQTNFGSDRPTWEIVDLYLSRLPLPAEGWVMVPREPTDEMLVLGARQHSAGIDGQLTDFDHLQASLIYGEMLSAIPSPEKGEGEQ